MSINASPPQKEGEHEQKGFATVTVHGLDFYSYTEIVAAALKLIDWQRVKTDPRGWRFAYIKCGEGWWEGYDKFTFNRQYRQAKDAGLLVGAYHYWHLEYDPIKQARYFYDRCKDLSLDLPPAIDIEDQDYKRPVIPVTNADYVSNYALMKKIVTHLHAYITEITRLFGRKPVIYTGAWWINWLIKTANWYKVDVTFLTSLDLWVASYTQMPYMPLGWKDYKIWQYSSTNADIPGWPSRNADQNVFNGSEQDLLDWCGGAACLPETPAPIAHTVTVTANYLAVKTGAGTGKTLRYVKQGDVLTVGDLVNGYYPLVSGGWVNSQWVK